MKKNLLRHLASRNLKNFNLKFFFLAIIIGSLASACKVRSPIVGSWKELDIANAGDSIIEKITFSETDTLTIVTLIKGMPLNEMKGHYEISKDYKYLSSKMDTLAFNFEILKLDKTYLELRPKGRKIMRFERYDH